MKKIQYLFASLVISLGLTSCGDSFLTQYPEGGLLLEDQYDKVPDRLAGSVRGIYSKLYEYGGHSTFGERSIDMYTDIQSGDMAMKKSNYGWFENYERGNFYAYARSYIWSYYYEIIHLVNLCEISIEGQKAEIFSAMATGDASDEIKLNGYYYGQLLALRGMAYAGLLNYYTDPHDATTTGLDSEKALPIYVGKDVAADTLGAPLSTVTEVYTRVYDDLSDAITLIDYYSQFNNRESKLEIDADVARLLLAYAMLNHGDKTEIIAGGKNCYEIAQDLAEEVINGGKYPLLKYDELTTTGFSDVNAANWMWGEDVTVENTTALGSFFGQVDIHTYSYAWAGDTKCIDSKLYDDIVTMGWDGRKAWFRSGTEKYPYCPDGKFYNPKTKHTTAASGIDRDWLCDNIFMRVELAYLIAAEAAWNNDNLSAAKNHLEALCNERVEDPTDATYQAWLGTLSSTDAVKDAIVYNWRVEMWGEGYSMQVLRRIQKQRTLGSNHISRGETVLDITGAQGEMFMCEIPTSETRYNPALSHDTQSLQYNPER